MNLMRPDITAHPCTGTDGDAQIGNESDFLVRFWGVRGSIATSDPDTMRYGGNTSSLEIRCGKRLLMLDAGTGIRYLGNQLCKSGEDIDADLLLTHTHYDHVGGIPFFTPFYAPNHQFRIWAGHLLPELDLHSALCDLMVSPLFPITPEMFNADIDFCDFLCGDTLDLGDGIIVRTGPLNHPDRATGYRIEFCGKSICYLTDTEHVPGKLDRNLLELIGGADLVIYDSMFTEEEYIHRVGWGHSTWEAGVALCDAADVKTLVIFHHDPDHNDEFMDGIARQAAQRRPGTVVAREGMVLRP
jgi:phosphoribosyl 1,2-cyclic phosphodiesterase